MRSESVSERASEKLVQSRRPGPWPGDSSVTSPTGSLRLTRRLRARRRPGPWPGDSDVTYPSPTGSRRHGADHGDHGGHGGHGGHGAGRGGPLTRRRREPGSGIHHPIPRPSRSPEHKPESEASWRAQRTTRGEPPRGERAVPACESERTRNQRSSNASLITPCKGRKLQRSPRGERGLRIASGSPVSIASEMPSLLAEMPEKPAASRPACAATQRILSLATVASCREHRRFVTTVTPPGQQRVRGKGGWSRAACRRPQPLCVVRMQSEAGHAEPHLGLLNNVDAPVLERPIAGQCPRTIVPCAACHSCAVRCATSSVEHVPSKARHTVADQVVPPQIAHLQQCHLIHLRPASVATAVRRRALCATIVVGRHSNNHRTACFCTRYWRSSGRPRAEPSVVTHDEYRFISNSGRRI